MNYCEFMINHIRKGFEKKKLQSKFSIKMVVMYATLNTMEFIIQRNPNKIKVLFDYGPSYNNDSLDKHIL